LGVSLRVDVAYLLSAYVLVISSKKAGLDRKFIGDNTLRLKGVFRPGKIDKVV